MQGSPIAGQCDPVLGCGSILGRARDVPPAAKGLQPAQLLVSVCFGWSVPSTPQSPACKTLALTSSSSISRPSLGPGLGMEAASWGSLSVLLGLTLAFQSL